MFQPAKRFPLSEVVLHQLLERMRDHTLQPGQRLPTEAELTRLFGVGRSSVREALRVLIAMGLIETKAGRGAIVLRQPESLFSSIVTTEGIAVHLERMTILDVLEVRKELEGKAAQLAAEHRTQDKLLEIERCAKEVERHVLDGVDYHRANMRFHLAVASASQNQAFVETLRPLFGTAVAFRKRLMAAEPRMRARDLKEHSELVGAIRMRDGPRARDLAVRHVLSAIEAVQKFEVGNSIEPIRRPGGQSQTAFPIKSRYGRSRIRRSK